MDMLKFILDSNNLKSSCFLCFKICDNMSSLFQNFVVFIEYGTVEMKLKDIISYLFPSYFQDILSNKACIECVDLLVKIFTTLQRNLFKKKILSKITERLYTETDLVKSNFAHINKLYINLKLPGHEEITQKDAAVVELKNDSLTKEELKEVSILSSSFQAVNCKRCPMTFPTKEMLKDHAKIAHNTSNKAAVCEYCGKVCKKTSTLKAHLKSHKESTCPYCFKVLKSHSHFKLHVKSHNPNFSAKRERTKIYYSCDGCSFKSQNKRSLIGHINKIHLKIRPFICNICSKGFYRNSNLIEHMIIHNERSCMTCEQCGLKFFHRKTLLEHLRLHTGEKPFQCEICKENFVTSSRRTAHFKRKHMEKSVICVLCDKKFSFNSELNTHLKKYHGVGKN